MKLLKKHTTSKGNKLEFHQFETTHIIVIDNSCQMERVYRLGDRRALCWDDFGKRHSKRTEIRSFEQVINAWVNEEIHF